MGKAEVDLDLTCQHWRTPFCYKILIIPYPHSHEAKRSIYILPRSKIVGVLKLLFFPERYQRKNLIPISADKTGGGWKIYYLCLPLAKVRLLSTTWSWMVENYANPLARLLSIHENLSLSGENPYLGSPCIEKWVDNHFIFFFFFNSLQEGKTFKSKVGQLLGSCWLLFQNYTLAWCLGISIVGKIH